MGNYKSTHRGTDNTKLERIYPEPNYQIKTRPPCNVGNTWRKNVTLKVREEQLADEAMPMARRKCFEPIMEFIACQSREGMFWLVFNCQEEWFYASECMQFEFYVEMDKRRRDMKRNPESWWREFYDENGEVGKQKEMKYGELDLWNSVKFTFLGESAIADEAYKYPKQKWFPFHQKKGDEAME